jgi:hypothetical protein
MTEVRKGLQGVEVSKSNVIDFEAVRQKRVVSL